MRFLGERDALGDRLAQLDSVCETTGMMIGRTSVELLMTKKAVHERLRAALDAPPAPTPDQLRLGGVHYVAGDEPFRDLHRPTADFAALFRPVADTGDRADDSRESSSSSDSDDSDSDDERPRESGAVSVVCELPQVEHIDLVVRESKSEDSDEDDEKAQNNDEDEKVEDDEEVSKICISDGVVQRIVIRSYNFTVHINPIQCEQTGACIPADGRPSQY